jgi:predicted nucleic acid-binding protein
MITYLDSGVLLAAWKNAELRPAALRLLENEAREFCTSQLVKLELLPKPAFEKRQVELRFYHSYFQQAVVSQPLDQELGNEAQLLAEKYGLAAVDALHIAAARCCRAEEFYTSEKPGKPMFRVKELKIVSLHSL